MQLAVAAKPRPRAASRAAAGGEAGGAVAGPPMLAPSPSSLFVEILNHYLYFFDHGCTLITPAVLQVRCGARALRLVHVHQHLHSPPQNLLARLGFHNVMQQEPLHFDPHLPLQSLLELVANEMSAEACKEDQPLQVPG